MGRGGCRVRMKSNIFYFIFLVLVPSSQLVLGADCDYTPLNNQISTLESENILLRQINSSYYNLVPKYNDLNKSYDELVKDYEKIKAERDLFESKYLNTSLGNMTIGDFIIYMNNIENHYNSINQSISTQINQMTTIRNWTLGISITFSLALISITFIFFKYLRKYLITKISEITKIKVKHETKIQTK
jgi:hypothetical protein